MRGSSSPAHVSTLDARSCRCGLLRRFGEKADDIRPEPQPRTMRRQTLHGPRKLDDHCRADKRGWLRFDEVMKGLRLFQKSRVECNVLNTENRIRADHRALRPLREHSAGSWYRITFLAGRSCPRLWREVRQRFPGNAARDDQHPRCLTLPRPASRSSPRGRLRLDVPVRHSTGAAACIASAIRRGTFGILHQANARKGLSSAPILLSEFSGSGNFQCDRLL